MEWQESIETISLSHLLSWRKCSFSFFHKMALFSCYSVPKMGLTLRLPWMEACQASLSFTVSQSLLKLISIESVMPSNHLILCCLLVLPSIFPSIRIFSKESVLPIRWPEYWSFSFSTSPSDEYLGLISLGLTGLISLQSKGLLRVFSNTTVRKHPFLSAQPSLWSNSHIYTWLLEKP